MQKSRRATVSRPVCLGLYTDRASLSAIVYFEWSPASLESRRLARSRLLLVLFKFLPHVGWDFHLMQVGHFRRGFVAYQKLDEILDGARNTVVRLPLVQLTNNYVSVLFFDVLTAERFGAKLQ